VDTKALLDHVAQRDTGIIGSGVAEGLDKYCPQYSINTHLRLAHFLAQILPDGLDGRRHSFYATGPTEASALRKAALEARAWIADRDARWSR
jgi:hypothetical protein